MVRPPPLYALAALFTVLLFGAGACSSITQSPPVEATPQDPEALAGTWSLVSLEGAPVAHAPRQRHPTLRFDTETMRATGFAGVNQFGGSYDAAAGTLTFAPLIMTRMAGPPEQMDLERRFSGALQQTTGWRIVDDHLELLAGERVVARFSRIE